MMEKARALLQNAHILTLATQSVKGPWAADVYYAPHTSGLYFFSNASARHIKEGLEAPVAATIHQSPFHPSEIEGFQAIGTLESAPFSAEASAAFGLYLKKFDFLPQLFSKEALKGIAPFLKREKKMGWYRFVPHEMWYIDSSRGFGNRSLCHLDVLLKNQDNDSAVRPGPNV